MKKNGFTLAEVLITLAIIGVIATMTLPSLMTNTQEQQAKTGFKKGINTLQNAVEMNAAAAGFDYATITDTTLNEETQSLYSIIANRTQVDFGKSGESAPSTQTTKLAGNYEWITFRDGSAIGYIPSETESTAANTTLQADGLPLGFTVVFDTNGAKAPNIVSNCKGTALGAAAQTEDDDATNGIVIGGGTGADAVKADIAAACPKAKRVIKDQFLVQLRGTTAQPRGAAATWVWED